MKTSLALLLSITITLSSAPSIFAQINSGPDDGNPGFFEIVVGTPDIPPGFDFNLVFDIEKEIIFDPDAGPWVKLLVDPTGAPVLADDNTFNDPLGEPQTVFRITETITVGPGIEWTDWHEQLPPGFIWTTDAFPRGFLLEPFSVTIDRPTGPDESFTSVDIIGENTGNNQIILNGPDFWIFFDPILPAGTILTLEKNFNFVGPDGQLNLDPIDVFSGQLEIIQFPTAIVSLPIGGEIIPIDSTALLLAGAQMNAAWMIPAIVSAIGIGIVIARKF